MGRRGNRYTRVLSRFAFAVGIALLFVFLGQFAGIGYHVHSVQELSFVPYLNYGYADAQFRFDGTFNPVLYPFYWLVGRGQVSGNFSMTYLPPSYEPGDFAVPNYGRSASDRYGNYVSFMVTWGILGNFLVLAMLTIAMEVVARRVLYLILFSSIVGFSAAGIGGTIAGSIVGILAAVYLLKGGFAISLSGLQKHILKRVFYSFALVIIVITVDFVIFMRMPSNPMDFLAKGSLGSTEEQQARKDQLRTLWGIDQPLLPQYFTYLRNLLTWNLGEVGMPLRSSERSGASSISQQLGRRLPYTVFLLGASTAISAVVGILLGIVAVRKRNGIMETLLSISSAIASSLPAFWIGLLFLFFFSYGLRWFPFEGGYPTTAWAENPPIPFSFDLSSTNLQMIYHINLAEGTRLVTGYLEYAILPICTQTLFMFGTWVLLTRASMTEVLSEDYLVTARAKGVKEWNILAKHAFRNACLPIVTSTALSFGLMLTGSIIVESVFRYPGIGTMLYESTIYGDNPVLMTIFYVVSISLIAANAIADLLYGILDPRIKLG